MSEVRKDRKQVRIGCIQRIREIVGIKQLDLPESVGWREQQMSNLEKSETIDDSNFEIIAKNWVVNPEFHQELWRRKYCLLFSKQ